MHGGAGAVLSIGLMKAIPFEAFEDCVHNTYSTGGDAIISICLWEVRLPCTSSPAVHHAPETSSEALHAAWAHFRPANV